ncbi:copper chaperone PCu(A)C [Pararhodobacter oceanensis]|uniref:Copper-binding protein n=1 Tax=Pararhodobacter oceanensis TaxID=2172121 RepID=A0A2T8HV28_9RHOB|nr:copper chaperone PCu(A)C [Pararhodobacter oceanensis]PVH29284.1 copper-binding protein [Pararhodobacter oceanensis]
MIRFFTLTAAAALLSTPALACAGFEVHHAYARASMPSSPTGGAFMVLVNTGENDCHVTGARSDVAQRTELHTHIQDENGVMRMREVEDGFHVPAGGEHELARGGDHVMFMGLNAPFEQDAILEVTFDFADGSEHRFEVPVDLHRMPAEGHDHAHDHGHGESHGDHGDHGEMSHDH